MTSTGPSSPWADFTSYQIKSIADQDCLAPYVGADFTEYQWQRCRMMIGEQVNLL